jgi:DNA polymerase (family 10)
LNDKFHILAYDKAIYAIKNIKKEITSIKDVANIAGIGVGMKEKINIILKSKTHPKIPEMLNVIATSTSELDSIMGFGSTLIKLLKKKYNISTIVELDAYLAISEIPEMTNIAKLGWKYRVDLATQIPRNETQLFFEYLNKSLEHNINLKNVNLEIQLAGSFPSGKLFSKDIDILAFYNNESTNSKFNIDPNNIMDEIIKSLETFANGGLEIVINGSTKFIGLVKINNIYRHLDIALYPVEFKPYAILYFTSGKVANQIMREKAKRLGYKLNEFGLFNRESGKRIQINEPVIENIKKILKL